ncbi:hypothetical protein BDA96_08G016900 [Sorghum bicolor]|uniref:No apical meristem-associated C-terminal domain-containing protein n=1 Tax=Sorghum bicolor TaxID=4558 RepID=A0A921U6B6_SORBI|nr:hypothetical protein BDA96_08G016900 [Sorghum bicolor]
MAAASGGRAAVGMGAAGGWEIPAAPDRLQLVFVDPGSRRMRAAARRAASVVGECGTRRPAPTSPCTEQFSCCFGVEPIPPCVLQRVEFTEMDSGRPLTDMIMEGFTPGGVSNNVPHHNEIEASKEVPAVVKSNKKRSKNFTVPEDEMLVSAWLNVSLDPIRGVNQSKDTYWKRIRDFFHLHKDFESNRTQSSLMSRWSSIQHECNTFAHCVSRVEARNQSGASVDDKQANALTMYKNEDQLHRTFQYIHCWKKLKDHSKWINRPQATGPQKPFSKKQKTTANSTPTDALDPVTGTVAETQTATTTVVRPPGTKKEKQKLKQRSSIEALDYLLAKKKEVDAEKELKRKERELKKEERELKKQEMCQKALALQEERIKLDKEKFDFERDQEEERIINIDMSTLSTRQQQFYDDQQKKILARRLGN